MQQPSREELDTAREFRRGMGSVRSAAFVSGLLALAAAGISGYLVYASTSASSLPPCCGEGSGCQAVLSSKWSTLAGVPIGVPAMGVHLALAALAVACVRVTGPRAAAISPWLALVSSVAIAAAGWFVFLQVAVLGAICPWCMADHAMGVTAGGLGLFVAIRRGRRRPRLAVGGVVAVFLVALMGGAQAASTPAVATLDDMPTDRDFDRSVGDERLIGLLDGSLRLNLSEEPGVGPMDAPAVALMYDYACPHCRHTHEVLKARLAEDPDAFRMVLLPVPLNRACNPHAPASPGSRFNDSCELATLALAVWRAAPERFAAFDDWLYTPETPRTAAAARAEAERLVGTDALGAAEQSPWVRQKIARNAEAYGGSGSDRVPVLLRPGASPVVGRIEAGRHLDEVLATPATLSAPGGGESP